jgi:hypothetical protein
MERAISSARFYALRTSSRDLPGLVAVRVRSELIVLADDRPKIWEMKHDDCGDHQADDAEQHGCDKVGIVDHSSKSGQ